MKVNYPFRSIESTIVKLRNISCFLGPLYQIVFDDCSAPTTITDSSNNITTSVPPTTITSTAPIINSTTTTPCAIQECAKNSAVICTVHYILRILVNQLLDAIILVTP